MLTHLPLVFSEDFEKGRERWKPRTKKLTHREVSGNKVLELIEDKAITKQIAKPLPHRSD